MSARNRRPEKKLRSLRRAIRKGRIQGYIDLVKWLRDRGYANTAGRAREIILAGEVTAGGEVVGVKERLDRTGQKVPYVAVRVPSYLADEIACSAPKVKHYA